MDKMDFFSTDNILILAEDSKKGKKGGGTNAILALLQEFNNLTDKIQSCAEAQDITENKQKIEEVGKELDKHFQTLLDMVKSRGKDQIGPLGQLGKDNQIDNPDQDSKVSSPTLPSTPTPLS